MEIRSGPRGTSRWISPATTSRGHCSFRHCFTLFTEYFAPFDHSTYALSVPVAILRLSGNPPARDSCCTIKQHYSKGATEAGGRVNIGSAGRTVTGFVTLFHLHHSRFLKIVGPEFNPLMLSCPQTNISQRSVKSSREAQVIRGRPEKSRVGRTDQDYHGCFRFLRRLICLSSASNSEIGRAHV